MRAGPLTLGPMCAFGMALVVLGAGLAALLLRRPVRRLMHA